MPSRAVFALLVCAALALAAAGGYVIIAMPPGAPGERTQAEAPGRPAAAVFDRCRTCHSIRTPDGTNIVRGGQAGPNLYGVIGRRAGTAEGYDYGPSVAAAGEAGLVWDRKSFLAYVRDPTGFVKSYLDDPSARSRMAFALADGGAEIYEFLVQAGPGRTPAE